MRLGWIVLAHSRPAQVARLIARLQNPGDHVFLHVDRSAALAPFLAALGPRRDGVSLLPRHRSRWGSYGVAEATLDGMRAGLEHGADFMLVVSGQDYPIKPLEALRERLGRQPDTGYMHFFELPNPDWSEPEGGLWRLNRRHYRLGRRSVHVPNRLTPFVPLRRLPLGLVPFAGANWWCLPRCCAADILEFLQENPQLEGFWRRVALPAESLFHTILLNGPLRDQIVFDDLRYIVWTPGAAHPKTLDAAELPWLARSPAYLARKFDAERDPRVLDLIDEQLLGAPVDT